MIWSSIAARAAPVVDRMAYIGVAILVTWLFVILLINQMAQNTVIEGLRSINQNLGYSASYGAVLEDEARERRLAAVHSELQDALAAAGRLRAQIVRARITLDSTRSRFQEIAGRVRERCGLEFDPANPATLDGNWSRALACSSEPGFPPTLKSEIDVLHSTNANPSFLNLPTQSNNLRHLEGQLAQTEVQIRDARQLIETLGQALTPNANLRAAFVELKAIRDRWYLGGDLLVAFPPGILRLPLAFASGAFGALLISLVIAVYPGSGVGTTAQGAAWRAIFLGGLIALSVFVVLLGGSAVLGVSAGLGDHEGNYMTFSAVGILAGMFSDRVAGWLNENAGRFFSTTSQGTQPRQAS